MAMKIRRITASPFVDTLEPASRFGSAEQYLRKVIDTAHRSCVPPVTVRSGAFDAIMWVLHHIDIVAAVVLHIAEMSQTFMN